jgi:hypothetical protein
MVIGALNARPASGAAATRTGTAAGKEPLPAAGEIPAHRYVNPVVRIDAPTEWALLQYRDAGNREKRDRRPPETYVRAYRAPGPDTP